MGNVHRMSMLMHDESIRPDGTGDRTYYQPENIVDYGPGSESGVTFQLDVHGTVGTADSWYLTTKFQLGMGDIAGSGWAQQRWRDLQPEQIAKLICEGVDWYGGIAAPFSLTNLCTNPSLETASTGWSAVSGTGGTAAGARLTTSGYSGAASYRITWSVATTSSGTGGISSQSGAVTAGAVYSGGMRVRPSKDQWTAEVNTVARSTDTLPVTVSRTIKNFGRLVRVYIVPVAVNPSSDFAVTMTLTSSY
jgi:hypothetical protein